MRDDKANALIDKIVKYTELGFDPKKLVADLKKLRPFALEEEDPLVTKVIRLAYEYIEAEESFQFMPQEEEEEEMTESVESAEEEELADEGYELGMDHENMLHFLTLLKKSDNKFNREEIKSFRTQLKEELY